MKRAFVYQWLRYLFYILERIGIKVAKSILYMKNIDVNENFDKNYIDLEYISIRCCTKEDINSYFKGDKKLRFNEDLKQGHIMIGVFFNQDLVAYSWLSFQKVYATEVEKWVDVEGGYIWRGFTTKKYRNKGIGKEMLRYSFKITKEKGIHHVYSVTDAYNIPARKALEKMDFKRQRIMTYMRVFNLEKRSERKIVG